jgi:hypothetical protein
MDLSSLPADRYACLRDDIRHRGIQVPILVDSKTGEVIDDNLNALDGAKSDVTTWTFVRAAGSGRAALLRVPLLCSRPLTRGVSSNGYRCRIHGRAANR